MREGESQRNQGNHTENVTAALEVFSGIDKRKLHYAVENLGIDFPHSLNTLRVLINGLDYTDQGVRPGNPEEIEQALRKNAKEFASTDLFKFLQRLGPIVELAARLAENPSK